MDATIPKLEVRCSPHMQSTSPRSAAVMRDVLVALLPCVAVAVWFFGPAALLRIGATVLLCLFSEDLCCRARGRRATLRDGSAALTGVLLALSLPPQASPYVLALAAFSAIALGKAVYGGLGQNLFNPAMVGRAVVSVAFPGDLTGAAYATDGWTGATPLGAFKLAGEVTPLDLLFSGRISGSLGEGSALAILLGGAYLLLRRSASWQIPLALLSVTALLGLLSHGVHASGAWSFAHDLFSGALLFGAVFIATDPVTSPLSHAGRLLFGAGVGVLTWFFRRFSGYPEGMMFAVLLMNAATPLINQYLIPEPVGGGRR